MSFVLDIENLQHNFSCLKRHFHFLGLTASLGLNVQPWSECPASAFGLGWTTFRPRLDNLQTSADNCQTSEIKVPLAARKVGLQFFHVLESLKIGPRNCYSIIRFLDGVADATAVCAGVSILMKLFPNKVSQIMSWTEMLFGLGYMLGK